MDKRINIDTDLLPCPFCGGHPQMVEWAASPIEIKCEACGIAIDGLRAEVIAAWNRRATPPATGAMEDLPPLPAGATSAKTWRERYREEFEKGIASGEPFLSPDECKDAEITELRAAMRDAAIAHYLRRHA